MIQLLIVEYEKIRIGYENSDPDVPTVTRMDQDNFKTDDNIT